MKVLLLAVVMSFSALAQPATGAPEPAASPAPQQSVASPQGRVESAVDVADPVFTVRAKVLGLERNVEMLQWKKSEAPSQRYETAWSAERVDSSAFDAAHRNPGEFPFNGERWWSTDATLDGHPVSAEVLGAVDAWGSFKPDLSQLPTNLAVSFQPDGDWLSTSQDAAHPQVGDVRVRWRAITSAAAPRGSQLVDGRWEMAAKPAAVASTRASSAMQPVPPANTSADIKAWVRTMFGAWAGWLVVGGVLLAFVLLLLRRRRRRRR